MTTVEVAQKFFQAFPAYPEYKDSEIDWIGKIPTHWEVKRVKYTSLILIPQRNKPELNFDEGIPWITMDDLTSYSVEKSISGYYVSEYEAKKAGSKTLPIGCVISSCVGNFGVASVNTNAVIINQQLQAYFPKKVNSYFLRYLVSASKEYFERVATATTLVYVNREKFGEMPVVTPSLNEQKSIAHFLDQATAEIDHIIDQQQQLIALLEEERTTVISHAVTKGLDPSVPMQDSGVEWLGEIPAHWEAMRVKFCLTSLEQGWSPVCESRLADDNEWGVLKAGCVNGKQFDPNEHKTLPANTEPYPELEIKPGDVLMSRANTRELVGSVSLVEEVRPKLLLCDKLFRLNLRNEIANRAFFVLSLGSVSSRFQIEFEATGSSSSMQNIGQDSVLNLVLPLPSLEEQKKVLAYISLETARIDEAIQNVKDQIAKLEEYRTALISDAVTGKIDVRGFNQP